MRALLVGPCPAVCGPCPPLPIRGRRRAGLTWAAAVASNGAIRAPLEVADSALTGPPRRSAGAGRRRPGALRPAVGPVRLPPLAPAALASAVGPQFDRDDAAPSAMKADGVGDTLPAPAPRMNSDLVDDGDPSQVGLRLVPWRHFPGPSVVTSRRIRRSSSGPHRSRSR